MAVDNIQKNEDLSSLIDGRVVHIENWAGHEDLLNQLFSLYKEKVNPLISVYNALENAFPVGVINELRDVFSHLTQSAIADNDDDVVRHLDKAQRHLKRAVVDAFKYACMAYSKVYDDFRESFKYVDLGYVDNGTFLPRIAKLNAEAEQLMYQAKLIESDIHEDSTMYAAYEATFNAYTALYESILSRLEAAEAIKLKAIEDANIRKKEHRVDRILAIGGVAVGVIGIVVSYLIACFI